MIMDASKIFEMALNFSRERLGPQERRAVHKIHGILTPEECAWALVAALLPADVVTLVIRAREFLDKHECGDDESRALDNALEAFSERIPYENEPTD